MGKLEQKVALVTGGARGIGKQICLTLAEAGADIVVDDIRDMDSTVKEVQALGREVLAVKADISRKEQVKALFEAAINRFQKIDILVNNAGTTCRDAVVDMSEDDWDLVQHTNLKGCFLCTQAAARHMVAQKSGKIVNIASMSGTHHIIPNSAVYSASKAGIIQLTRVSARELGPYNINVNAIAPGTILTDFTYNLRTREEVDKMLEIRKREISLGRIGRPLDVARLALFLCTEDASYISGQVIGCDGGAFN